MITKELGKITCVSVGFGGYQDVQFGVWFNLGGKDWGVSDGKGFWADSPSTNCKWTKKDQDQAWADTMAYLCKLCKITGVKSVNELKGKPVEVSLENNTIKSWRLLTEVL